jgi:hypothetical protein
LHVQSGHGEHELVRDGWSHFDDAAAPVQDGWGAGPFGQIGHELASLQIQRIRAQSLAGTQVRTAIITFGQRLLGLLDRSLFPVVPISGAPPKPEAEASEHDYQTSKDGFLHKCTGP